MEFAEHSHAPKGKHLLYFKGKIQYILTWQIVQIYFIKSQQVAPDVDPCAVSQHGYPRVLIPVFTFGWAQRQSSEIINVKIDVYLESCRRLSQHFPIYVLLSLLA